MATARGVAAGPSTHVGGTGEPADKEAVAGDRSVPLGSSATMFQVGDLVVLRSDPGSVVPIVEVMPGGAEIPSCPKIRTEPESSYVNS